MIGRDNSCGGYRWVFVDNCSLYRSFDRLHCCCLVNVNLDPGVWDTYLTSMILHKARIAFALYRTSPPTPVSFIILWVIIITSEAELASSLKTRYIICRSEGSLFWKSFEMPKKRSVASLVGNDSPVKRRSAILVRRIRHFRGDIGE